MGLLFWKDYSINSWDAGSNQWERSALKQDPGDVACVERLPIVHEIMDPVPRILYLRGCVGGGM